MFWSILRDSLRESQNIMFWTIHNLARKSEEISKRQYLDRLKLIQTILGNIKTYFFSLSKTCPDSLRESQNINGLSKTCPDSLRKSQNVNFWSFQNFSRRSEGISKHKFLVHPKLVQTVWGNLKTSIFGPSKRCPDSREGISKSHLLLNQ